jgi:hypothetical protein
LLPSPTTMKTFIFGITSVNLRTAISGLFDHIWENMINPTMHNKLEKIHQYLVICSKLVHDAWIRERDARDARDEACQMFAAAGMAGTSGTSIATMLSNVLHNQKLMMNKFLEFQKLTMNKFLELQQKTMLQETNNKQKQKQKQYYHNAVHLSIHSSICSPTLVSPVAKLTRNNSQLNCHWHTL